MNIINKINLDLSKGILWNIMSYFFLGISGIIISIIVGWFYGSEGLGIFNQAYAIYIFITQIAVLGIHVSVLRFSSEYNNKKTLSSILSSGILLALIISIFVTILLFLSKDIIGFLYNSVFLSQSISYIVPGIILFSINKVFFSFINGIRKMKELAIFFTLRYLIMLIITIIFVLNTISIVKLPLIFTGAELFIMICMIFYLKKYINLNFQLNWVKKQFMFGIKSFSSGTLAELNSRLDILILGMFVSDSLVGIYSFGAMIAEGVTLIYVPIRRNINPVITKMYTSQKYIELKKFIRQGKQYFYIGMLFIVITTISIYPFFINIIFPDKTFFLSWYVYSIIMIGVLIGSGYLPFNMILSQTKFPGYYSIYISMIVVFNLIMNVLLIPFLSIYGAAMATGLILLGKFKTRFGHICYIHKYSFFITIIYNKIIERI
jgi:O-antigen/teichoic acid export membrane protein